MDQSSFFDRVSARGRHSELGTVAVGLVSHARRLAGLWIDNLHVRDVEPRFLVYNSAAPIAGRLLIPLDDAGPLNLHFAASRGHCQDATALAFVATGDQ